MADIVTVTQKPVRHSIAEKQNLRLAVDVSAYDELDLLLTVYESTGGSITVKIITGMQIESDVGWVDVASFTATAANAANKGNFKNFLRFIRYELITAGTTTTFLVNGVGRKWA